MRWLVMFGWLSLKVVDRGRFSCSKGREVEGLIFRGLEMEG